MHLCSYAKHADAVPDKNFQFWSLLTRAPCSSPNVNDVWQTPSFFFCVLWSERDLATLSMRLWLWRKPGDPKTLQYFHCDSWGFCCFSHHSPPYPGGQDAVASSTHEVFNSCKSFELLYNCSDSAQWYSPTQKFCRTNGQK